MRKVGITAMRTGLFVTRMRHPLVALLGVVIFGGEAIVVGRIAIAQVERFAAADDPVQISDRALDGVFTPSVAEREIDAALATGDVDLAQSFLELAAERGVAIDPHLADKVKEAQAKAGSVTQTAGRFAHGLWTGEPTDIASLAGTAVGDLFVFGDIRDAAREGTRYLLGQPADPWILGLAGAGIVITAGTYASLGVGTPARIGLSLVKAARRTDRLNPRLVERTVREFVKVGDAGGFAELAKNTGRIEAK